MKESLNIKLLVLFLALLLSFGNSDKAYAAVDVTATDATSAPEIVFGETYNLKYGGAEYTYNGDPVYMKLVVKEQGIFNMSFTKPTTSNGEFKQLHVFIYNEQSEVIFNNYTHGTCKDSSEVYEMGIGLDTGTYYLKVDPTSSSISPYTEFKPTFTPTEYCETESNDSFNTANTLSLGQAYTGYHGYDDIYPTHGDKYDYWKVDLIAGTKYKIVFTRSTPKEALDSFVRIKERGGSNEKGLQSNKQLDGSYVTTYTPKISGTHYIEFDHRNNKQYKYTISIDVELTDITDAELTLDKVNYNYTGKSIKPKVTVKHGDNVLVKDVDYKVSYIKNKNIGKGKVTITGTGNYKGTLSTDFSIVAKKGATFTASDNKYKVTSSSTVAFTGIKNTKIVKVLVPKTVKYGGKTFKVTSIADKALYKKSKVNKVTIEGNVKTIGKSAFEGCKKLKTVTIKSTSLKTVGKNALKGINSKATIKVPSKKLTSYKKLLKGKGQSTSVRIVK